MQIFSLFIICGVYMSTPEAVIEIGSTGVRLLVAEFTQERKRNILDRSEMPVSLGRDVFTSGSISRGICSFQCFRVSTYVYTKSSTFFKTRTSSSSHFMLLFNFLLCSWCSFFSSRCCLCRSLSSSSFFILQSSIAYFADI